MMAQSRLKFWGWGYEGEILALLDWCGDVGAAIISSQEKY